MPIFTPLEGRSAGVLLHLSSLPGQTGIGGLGTWAYKFIDFLAEAGVKYWQMLPVGPVSDDGSPYRSFSSCAGNPYFIDLPKLVELGLLEEEDLKPLDGLGTTKVDFAGQNALRFQVLEKAYRKFKKTLWWNEYGSFDRFKKKHNWLKPYALFMALKNLNGDKEWHLWPEDQRRFAVAIKAPMSKELADAIDMHEFWQYLFWGQWQKMRGYAVGRGVRLIGDVPIYVPQDSVDVWSAPEMFLLDDEGNPTCVGGCPPDYFDANGQRWGNPIYDWPMHKKTRYRWWMKRFAHTFELFDVVRIDHFRAFYDYWKIPASSPDAKTGEWVLGPGLDFFKALEAFVPHARLIAEDLGGDLHQGVKDLIRDTGLPGISVLEFAFGGDANNPYLPHNAVENQVAYTGTHDNNTLAGWIEDAPEHERAHALSYLNCHKGVFVETGIKATLKTISRLAVIPVQDLLGLGTWARMNVPGTPIGNWQWRMSEPEFSRLDSKWLSEQLRMYGRS
jgi:4-alpha-glucanotransferase